MTLDRKHGLIIMQGQKRWEKATGTGYENIRRLVHENLLPALERFSVLVSRLRGLSKFQETNIILGLSTQGLDNILDTTNCLQLLAHHILLSTGSELRQFLAFSTWLRQEIEIQSRDSVSASIHESNEKDPSIDHASTLEYIQGAMLKSRLNEYFNGQLQSNKKSQWDLAAQGRSLFELYKQKLNDLSANVPVEKQLPGLDALIAHLDTQCKVVFARIAETQRRNVRFGSVVSLGNGIPACMDMRMLVEVRCLRISFPRRLTVRLLACKRNKYVCFIYCVRAQR